MAISISIDSEGLKALVGHANGYKLAIEQCGQVAHQEDLKEMILALKQKVGLSGKEINLVLCNNLAKTKVSEVPLVSRHVLKNIVREEMQELVANGDDYLYDYYVMQELTGNQTGIVLCAAMAKEYIEKYKLAFSQCGLKLKSIDIAQSALFHFVKNNFTMRSGTFIFGNLCADEMEATLFHNGNYVQFSRSHIEGRGNLGMIAEVSKQLSSLASYRRTQRLDGELEGIYLCGLTEEEKAFCNNISNAVGTKTTVPELKDAEIKYAANDYALGEYLFATGNLYRK